MIINNSASNTSEYIDKTFQDGNTLYLIQCFPPQESSADSSKTTPGNCSLISIDTTHSTLTNISTNIKTSTQIINNLTYEYSNIFDNNYQFVDIQTLDSRNISRNFLYFKTPLGKVITSFH